MLKAFAPILGKKPKVLILGTMPGKRSLELGQYYGHPQNQFWKLLEAALGEPLHGLPYARRVRAVCFNGKSAYAFFKRHRGRAGAAHVLVLPSSSPAYAGMPLAKKKKAWRALAKYLG